MMKRILTVTALATLLLTSFAACSKKETPGTDITSTPTAAVSEENIPTENVDSTMNVITFGGYFTRDNAKISIYLLDDGWRVSAYYLENENDTPLTLSGPLSLSEGSVLIYSQDGQEISFEHKKKGLIVTVNKGNDYKIFEGSYNRIDQDIVPGDSVAPENGSTLELISRIALTHFMTSPEESTNFTLTPANVTYENAYMESFLLVYGDLFLATQADVIPEISDQFLCYALPKAEANNLLLTASAGKFSIDKLEITDSGIIYKDDIYYIPCYGKLSGGIAVSSDIADAETLPENISMDAAIVTADDNRFDLVITLNISADSAIGATGIRLDSIAYKLAE